MIFTVSQITGEIKKTLETGFSSVSVIGEISNFKPHNSGHWYFNLKDNAATICCTMWKGYNNYVFFTPQDGMKIVISGKLTVYPPRGNYQIDVRSMKPAGAGELQAAFEMLKQKLSSEGLFSQEYKKEIPVFPQKIGIVTAIDGAALQDMINICRRRFPLVGLLIAPSKVQGSGAAETIAASIAELNARNDIDVIIVARGGGSIEDLWAFNEEKVARAIFDSRIPVISGVGHEIDFTIADFVADLRAPTPSAAMEIATPDKRDFYFFLNEYIRSSTDCMEEITYRKKDQINRILTSYGFRKPLEGLKKNSVRIKDLLYRIMQNMDRAIMVRKHKLSLLTGSIEANDVQRTLKKGFVLVKQEGKFVTRFYKFDASKEASLRFFDGEISVHKNNTEG